jgi:hypothetical protein
VEAASSKCLWQVGLPSMAQKSCASLMPEIIMFTKEYIYGGKDSGDTNNSTDEQRPAKPT